MNPPPPPSQSQSTPKSTLFSNPDGTPIRVFTQADLYGRAKVVKDLRLNGAELSSDASNAQIMLVDPPTRQGRQFIRDWGKDCNKTVVNFVWVKKCLEAKRPLLAEDKWGDFLAQDDGRPIDDGGDRDIVDQPHPNPLPTPRVTPEELARIRSNANLARRSPVPKLQPEVATPAVSPPPTASNVSAPLPPDMVSSQPLSPTAITPVSGMNPFMFMQNPATMNMQNPIAMQNPTPMNMQNIPASVLALSAQATQAFMANMFMNASQQPFSSDAFLLALQDSMRNHAATCWPTSQHQNGSFATSPPISPLHEPPVPFPSASSSSRARKVSPVTELSKPRRISSTLESETSVTSGKYTKRSASPSAKRRKLSSSSGKVIDMDDASVSSKGFSPPEKLFETKTGRPLSFFVQIEIHSRVNLVTSIKKSGGLIVCTLNLADYAILSSGSQTQKVFKTLLQTANNAGVPAIQAKFVYDCLSRKKLLDPEDYLYEPDVRRIRSISEGSIESEDQDSDIDTRKRKSVTISRDTDKKMKKPADLGEVNPYRRRRSTDTWYPKATDGPRTPSPPPESTRELHRQGYRYSEAENSFALRFAKIMIDRDYTISQNAVATAIHQKLPHHPLGSWRNHLSMIATNWATWRKRSAIAHRKAQLRKDSEATTNSNSHDTLTEFTEIETSDSAPTLNGSSTQFSNQDLDEDLEVVVRFFVEGNDRDQNEDESVVWQRLADKTPCKTERNWEVFYEKHAEVVVARFNASF